MAAETRSKSTRAQAVKPENDKQSKGRQQEVLDTAARIFREKGYKAATVQDIADALGMLKGSIYYYIKSKEELLYTLVYQVHQSELAMLDAVPAVGGDPAHRLRALVEAHVLANLENHMMSGIFHHDFRSLSEPHRSAIIKERDRVEQTMHDIIREGRELGAFRKEADAKILTLGILGMANSFYTWYTEAGDNTPAEIAAQFAEFTVRGLLANGPASPLRA